MSAEVLGRSLHAYGYEGKVEEAVPVEEIHRASCSLCDWVGEEHDGLDWRGAEDEAVQHYEDNHREPETGDQDTCGECGVGIVFDGDLGEWQHEEPVDCEEAAP